MEKLVAIMQSIGDFWEGISNAIVSIAGFLTSILGFLYYSGRTLIVGVYKLFLYILDSSVFYNVSQVFLNLSDYIGIGSYFIYALLFVVVIRIVVAFVFKLMRLNIDYHKNESLIDYYNKRDKLR